MRACRGENVDLKQWFFFSFFFTSISHLTFFFPPLFLSHDGAAVMFFPSFFFACPNYLSLRSSDLQPLEGLWCPAVCWVILAGPYLTPDTSGVHGEELTTLFISHRTALALQIQVVA